MRNIVFKHHIIEPSEELTPVIRIAPFSSDYLKDRQPTEVEICRCKTYLNQRFSNFRLLSKGRSCLRESLSYYHLGKEDVVTILTTSGNFYISGCVTKTIEEQCRWSREVTVDTKVIFVNHEFGYPFKEWKQVEALHLPIIEDCAHSFFTEDGEIGCHGDFVIYSLPKAFPLQMGGVLKTRKNISSEENKEVVDYVVNGMALEIPHIEEIAALRLENYRYLCKELQPLGISPFFEYKNGIVPGVFLFSWTADIDYPHLKEFMQRNGVESSVFYGQHAFFIPVHHRLDKAELDYMCDLLRFYSINMLKK